MYTPASKPADSIVWQNLTAQAVSVSLSSPSVRAVSPDMRSPVEEHRQIELTVAEQVEHDFASASASSSLIACEKNTRPHEVRPPLRPRYF